MSDENWISSERRDFQAIEICKSKATKENLISVNDSKDSCDYDVNFECFFSSREGRNCVALPRWSSERKKTQFYLYYPHIWTSKFLPPRIRNDQFADLFLRLKNAHPLTTLKPSDEFDFLNFIFFVCGVDEKIISNFSSTYSDFWETFINVRETFVIVKNSG